MAKTKALSKPKKLAQKPLLEKDNTQSISEKNIEDKDIITEDLENNKNQELKSFSGTGLLNILGSNSAKFIIIFLLVVLIGALYLNKISKTQNLSNLKNKIIPAAITKISPNLKFTIDNVKEISGLYEFELTVNANTATKYTSYITKDGEIVFIQGIKVASIGSNAPAAGASTGTNSPKKITCSDIPKNQSPKLTAFVVSNCPYGLQIQRVFKNAISQLPAIGTNLEIKYIGDISNNTIVSMHGDNEAKENLRQICIRDEQPDKYWNYVGCYMQEGKTDQCLVTSGINTSQLNSCVADPNKGLKYAKADFDLAKKLGVSGSPTLILNDKLTVSEFDFGGRNPNAIKDIVSCAYQTKPKDYNVTISKDDVATAFSLTGKSTTPSNNTTAAGCGTQ